MSSPAPPVEALSPAVFGTVVEHSHVHGEHVHVHTHRVAGAEHEHGWHSPANACAGDDTFGREPGAPGANLGPIAAGKVYVPFVPGGLHADVVPLLEEQVDGTAIVLVDVSRSQYNYHALLARLWKAAVVEGRDFTLVEQDVGVPPGALDHFDACPELLCVHDYAVFGGLIGDTFGRPGAFGCTRFRAGLCRMFPELVDELDDRHWSHLDGNILNYLRAAGVKPHEHRPPATHFHDYQGVEPPPGWYDLRPWAKMPGDFDVEAALDAIQNLSRQGPLKIPEDIVRYEAILDRVRRPRVFIETGLAFAGTARYMAERCELVISIEANEGLIAAALPLPPNVHVYAGRSDDPLAPAMVRFMLATAPSPPNVIVSLDSDHREENVRAELDLYSEFVTPGSYLVVEDTFRHYVLDDSGEGDPWPAARDFLSAHRGEFVIDDEIEKLAGLTLNPGGWLRRV